MTVFNASPDAKVLGNAILSIVQSIDSNYLVKKYLGKHGFEKDSIDPNELYSLNEYLALLKDIHEEIPLLLSDIGRQVFSQAKFPPEVDSFEKALGSIGFAYQMNHKNDSTSSVSSEKQKDNVYHVDFKNPYPCSFDQGILQGIAISFGHKAIVDHRDKDCRMHGSEACHYRVTVIG